MLSVDVGDLRLFLHVLAACVWVGGQLTLAALVPALRAAGADVPRAAARRFAQVAWPAFAVLVATGVWNVQAEHARVHGSYRLTLVVKLVVVLISGLTHSSMRVRGRGRGWRSSAPSPLSARSSRCCSESSSPVSCAGRRRR